MPKAKPLSDDALATLLADKLVELANRPGVKRMAALQMAGLLPENGIEDAMMAHVLGCCTKTVSNTRRTALEKLSLKPEVRELARAITPNPES